MPVDAYSTAGEMLQALADGEVLSVELVDLHLDRIDRYNPAVNVIVNRNDEYARSGSAESDAARAAGETGALLGLPMTIKDAMDLAGWPSTNGVPANAENIADEDAPIVAKARAAGAVFLGKTNVPAGSGDWQASNKLFGTTNNPWNPAMTSGGSTGGAAAVATGMSPLEFGSDIGGSIRIPASFCGVYGHKPSETALPKTNLPNPITSMSVPGPLARSAADLELAVDLIAGPVVGEDVAWRLEIPPARHERLSDYRIAILPQFGWLPCDAVTLAAQEDLAGKLSRTGATVEVTSPDDFGDFSEYYMLYLGILNALITRGLADVVRQRSIETLRERGDEISLAKARGMQATIGDFINWHEQRERYRRTYRDFFAEWDILITPVTLRPAYPHTTARWLERTIEVDGVTYPYDMISAYPSLATLCGQPATNFPVGINDDGLPLGLQAIGPYLEDRTTMHFAGLVEREFGGFVAPPGFE